MDLQWTKDIEQFVIWKEKTGDPNAARRRFNDFAQCFHVSTILKRKVRVKVRVRVGVRVRVRVRVRAMARDRVRVRVRV